MNKNDYRKLVEACVGRKLLSTEVIHHIDGNHYNNKIDNLYIFKSARSHMLYHIKIGTLAMGLFNMESDNRRLAYLKKRILSMRLESNVYEYMIEKGE